MHKNTINLSGKKFGRLSVVSLDKSLRGKVFWNCICECGNRKSIQSYCLTGGESRSCGCLQKEILRERRFKHGKSKSKTFKSWVSMRARCLNKNGHFYSNYGGRGITICQRWHYFKNFLEDMGERPPNYSLERIDNNGNYTPSNCKWASSKEQNNNKRNNKILKFMGVERNISQWASFLNIKESTLNSRINRNWPIRRVLSEKPSHIRIRELRPILKESTDLRTAF